MLPAYSVSSEYTPDSSESSAERSNVCDALRYATAWANRLGVDCRLEFADPELQAEHWRNVQQFTKDAGLVAQIRRCFKKGEWSARAAISELDDSARSVITTLEDCPDLSAFAAAAIESLDRFPTNVHVGDGKIALRALSISIWREQWRTYSGSLHLYRFDDEKLTIMVRLLSTKAWDDDQLKPVGGSLLSDLESNAPFRRCE